MTTPSYSQTPNSPAARRTIRVNDRHELSWHEGMTVADVLREMNYTYHEIIVRVNGELVRKDAYDSAVVPDGADVRAIHLIAGG